MKIIILGAYAIGTHLAKLLSRNNHDTVLIDSDEERLANLNSDYDLMTIQASASKLQTLRDAGVNNADLFIAVTQDEALNLNMCMLAHALGAKRTVAKVDNSEYLNPKLKEIYSNLGVSSLIYPENLAAKDIVNGLKMSWVRQRWDVHEGALVMLGIKLRDTCEILNEPLKDLCKPESPYHIVAVKRGAETTVSFRLPALGLINSSPSARSPKRGKVEKKVRSTSPISCSHVTNSDAAWRAMGVMRAGVKTMYTTMSTAAINTNSTEPKVIPMMTNARFITAQLCYNIVFRFYSLLCSTPTAFRSRGSLHTPDRSPLRRYPSYGSL